MSTQNINKSIFKTFSLFQTGLAIKLLFVGLSSHITLTGTPVRQGLINIVYLTVNSREQPVCFRTSLRTGGEAPEIGVWGSDAAFMLLLGLKRP